MTLIEDLYYGNIAPFERNITGAKELKKAVCLADKLKAVLTEQQNALFEEFEKADSEVSCKEELRAFTVGFKLGARLIREIF